MEKPRPRTRFGGSAPTLVTYLLLLVSVVAPFVTLLRPYLVSLATGTIVAAICYPLYAKLRRRLPKWAAALMVTLGVVALVLLPMAVIAVGAFRQGTAVIGLVSQEHAPTLVEVVQRGRQWVPFIDTFGTPAELLDLLRGGLTSATQSVSGAVMGQIRAFPALVLQLALVVLTMYFALVDGRRLASWIGQKLPISGRIRRMLAASFHSATRAVVLASVAAAGAQAVLMSLGFWALGVPAVLLSAGLTFVLGWVPGLPMLVWGGGAVYLYNNGMVGRAALMVGVGVSVGIVDNVVRPLVLRGQRAIHPMVSLLAILGGVVWFGIAGVFIGPLIACMAIAVLEIWPAVARHCGIAVSGSGELVPNVPMPLRVASLTVRARGRRGRILRG